MISRPTGTVEGQRPDSPIKHQPPAVLDTPRSIRTRTQDDWLSLFGAAASSLALVYLLYLQVLPLSGVVGFAFTWYLAFITLYASLTALTQPRPIVVDRIVSALVQGAAALVGVSLLATLSYVFVRGWPAVHHINFFTRDMGGVGPQDSLTHGGIMHALVGTLIELAISAALALPLGVATAVYLSEVGGRLARIVRIVVEAMTALPDLVAGLFIYTIWIIILGQGRTGLAAGLALAITMMPIIARSSEVALRLVPSGLREASLALGSSQLRTIWAVVLPTARPGLATALILSVARGIGETAPVLIVSGASTLFNDNPLQNPMNSLPLFVYSAVRSGEPLYITRGYGAAAVLLGLVIILFALFRILSRPAAGNR